MASQVLNFLVQEPGVEPRRVTTSESVVKIGRVASAHLVLANPSVSRMHAVIEVTDDGATIIDLGSEPKTAVNGVEVNKHVLAAGDRIQIGDSLVVLEASGDASPLPLTAGPLKAASAPSGGAWNWGEAPKPRRERSVAGPIALLGLSLLALLAFLALR
jgi:pSer/pThr/pTyr-binding forkhead associated (FHA) protein